MVEEKEDRKTASVYFRGAEEVEVYNRIKEDAQVAKSIDPAIKSFSEYAKQILKDPLWPLKHPKLCLRFAWLGLWGPYGKTDTMVKALGGVPTRDRVREQGQSMTCDELLTGLRTFREMEGYMDTCKEVWSELYREKMKKQHGVDVDEIRV